MWDPLARMRGLSLARIMLNEPRLRDILQKEKPWKDQDSKREELFQTEGN